MAFARRDLDAASLLLNQGGRSLDLLKRGGSMTGQPQLNPPADDRQSALDSAQRTVHSSSQFLVGKCFHFPYRQLPRLVLIQYFQVCRL
jgi:hypothetical protein